MSYILDALKRADQERKQGEIPDLKSAPPAATGRGEKNRALLWLLPLAACLIAVAWFKPWQGETPLQSQVRAPAQSLKQPAPAVVAPDPEAVTTTEPEASISETEEPVLQLKEPVVITPQTEVAEPVAAEPVETAESPVAIPGIMEIPASVRSSLPAIKISGHIFDENPASRMVIINNRAMHEGRYIAEGLSIAEITESGIILDSNGTRFFMSTFDSWPQ